LRPRGEGDEAPAPGVLLPWPRDPPMETRRWGAIEASKEMFVEQRTEREGQSRAWTDRDEDGHDEEKD